MLVSTAVTSALGISLSLAATANFDGQYSGTAKALNVGNFDGTPCRDLTSIALTVQNGTLVLLLNPATQLTFSGPVSDDGAVVLAGRNNRGASGLSLSGRLSNGQFYGSTVGLACNLQFNLRRQ